MRECKIVQLTGYIRQDGRIGFRNHIVVIPLAGCAQTVALRVADRVPEAVALWQPLGCDLWSPDQERLGETLFQLASHPNVGGAIFLTLGCAGANVHQLPRRVRESGRVAESMNVQTTGGTSECVAKGVAIARQMAGELFRQGRVEVPADSIVLGAKCGASDPTSFEQCHPVTGACCDMLVDMGATVVLSEPYELYPSKEELAERAADPRTAQDIRVMINEWRAEVEGRSEITVDEDWGDPKQARINSRGAIRKAGTRQIQTLIKRNQLIGDAKGLVMLEGPSSDLIAMTALAAAGCNMLLFTTGRGTLVASPIMPTVKVTANEKTFATMEENIDFFTTGPDSAGCLLDTIVGHANGKPTKGELAGHGEMFIALEGVTF